MRRPNGFGTIVKLSGKRRKPYCVRITEKWEDQPDGKKKQIYKAIGYFPSKKEAQAFLESYNESKKSGVVLSGITFEEVFNLWSDAKFKSGLTVDAIKVYKTSFANCQALHNTRIQDIKSAHLQSFLDSCGKNEPTLKKIKSLLNQLFDYAVANDIISKNYADYVSIQKSESVIQRIPFDKVEIKSLWDNIERYEWIDTLLILIFTGLRVGELLDIKTENVFIEEKYMRGGSKTRAGINRVIPLHECIIPLVQKRLDINKEYLINGAKGKHITYDTYRDYYWDYLMENLRMKHLPHDCRHTFASIAHSVGMDGLCRKRIMGHSSTDITDNVYTHKEIEELIREVNKLPSFKSIEQ